MFARKFLARRAASQLLCIAPAWPQDIRGAIEPPIVGRYQGSIIKEQSVRAFNRAHMTVRLVKPACF